MIPELPIQEGRAQAIDENQESFGRREQRSGERAGRKE